MASGIEIEDVMIGNGELVEKGCFISVQWSGTLNRGDPFGKGEVSFRVGGRQVIAGLSRA